MSKVCTVFLAAAFVIAVSTNIASGGTLLTVPRSSVIVKGDGVELNCSINGSETLIWIFTSRITSNETKIYLGKGILDSVRSRYSIDNRISGQHSLIINSADMAHAGRYLCRSPTVTGAEAAAQLTVIDGPRNISIIRYEDRFECSADGNPTPAYRWTHVETNRLTKGPTFMLHNITTSEKAYTLQCTAVNSIASVNKNITVKDPGTGSWKKILIISSAIGGPFLFLLIIIIIICCVVRRKRLKGNTSARPDVALETDINSYDDIDVSSGPSPNGVRDGSSSRGRSNDMNADNLVYAEVKKPKGTREEKRAMNDQPSAIYADVKKKVNVNGSSTGRNGANLGENPQTSQTPNPGNKNCTGDDGTVYAELGEMKQQPTNKTQSAKPPVFSQVEIYASIDHRGIVPPPPPKL